MAIRIGCDVERIGYKVAAKAGFLFLPKGQCCDMEKCIALFQQIDPDVMSIWTFSGNKRDTSYRRHDGEWHASDDGAR